MSLADGLTQRVVFHASYWPVLCGLTVGLGFRVGGRKNVPGTGPCLLVANHQSFLDPWLIGNGSPRWLVYLARDNLFRNRLFAAAIRAYGAVPIDRGFGKEGLRMVLNQLELGRAVVVFAEGERTRDGSLQPLKPGIALLIKKAECPIVPVGLAGAFNFWPRHEKLPHPEPLFQEAEGRAIALVYGERLPTGFYDGIEREPMLADLSGKIQVAVDAAERLRRKPPLKNERW